MHVPPSPSSAPAAATPPGVYRCGSLTYTRRHLAVLFFWLLWGDFCYMVMEAVTNPIMQLRFKSLGASNFEMGLMLSTIPATLGAFLNPIISFKSDRFRSRWGRRIPFIMATLPFLCVCLVLLAFGESIGLWIHATFAAGASQERVLIFTFGGLLLLFTFFNTFVNAVFWYLFNDVVPEHLLARFMSWFRIMSMIAGALYNFFVFPHSGSHVAEIMCGAAVLYGVGFTLMCFNVKEGEYPPPPPYAGGGTGPVAAIKTYGRECHAIRHYWLFWASIFLSSVGGGIGMYNLFMNQKIGLSLEQIGQIAGTSGIVVGVLILGSGWLADRFHPIRVVMAGGLLNICLVLPANMIWLFWTPASNQASFYTAMAISIGIAAPIAALNGVWDPPLLMRLFPRSRYGQFCSTHNLWRTLGGVVGAPLAGLFVDAMVRLVGEERAYFFVPVWQLVFAIPAFAMLLLLYRSWRRYGGDDAYVPPIDEPPPTPAELEARAQRSTDRAGTRRWHVG